MSKHIAIDLGAESGRVSIVEIVGGADGRLTIEEVHRFRNGPVGSSGTLYWDVLGLWQEIKTGLRKASAVHGRDLRSVAVDTWGIDFALLDRRGKLISNPTCYRDPRTAGVLERTLDRMPREEIFRQSGGIQFLSINTLYQLLAMVEQGDPALEVADTFLMMPDLFHYWLSGRKACEFTDATSTQFFNAQNGGWAIDMLARLGAPSHFLPEVVLPGTILGELLPDIAEETGLHQLPVVAPASHDTASAVVAVPADRERFAWLSSGTWSLLGGISSQPIVSSQALAYNFSSYGGPEGLYLPWKNITGLWLLQECRRIWSQGTELIPYGRLIEEAHAAASFVAVIDPDAPEFLAPYDMPAVIAAYCREHGEASPSSRGETVRLILESLALRYRWTLEKLAHLQNTSFDALYVVGGGTQNTLLCQFTADACGIPVVAGPVEATTIGNAALQAIAIGELSGLQDARTLVRRTCAVTVYEPGLRAPWEAAYARFLRLIGQ
ncbi:MAG: rhamnulokinase family protein [Caldilinea sp.]